MKKLMIATAALCAAVGASALESANVVGYSTVNPELGWKNMTGVAFCNTSGGNLDIQSITCKDGTSADPGDGAFRMWWYDQTQHKYVYAVYSNDAYADDGEDDGAGTEYTDKYYWVTDDEDVFIYVPAGWKHDDGATATIVDHEKAFSVGEGFFIQPLTGSDPKVAFKNPFYVAE